METFFIRKKTHFSQKKTTLKKKLKTVIFQEGTCKDRKTKKKICSEKNFIIFTVVKHTESFTNTGNFRNKIEISFLRLYLVF